MITHPLLQFAILSMLATSHTILASAQCHEMARTALEHSYCEVTASGHGKTLPPLNEFRGNPEKIQRFLLKTPARRAGVKLPEPNNNESKHTKSGERSAKAVTSSTASSTSTASTEPASNALKDCTLHNEQVRCQGKRFLLATNLPNSALRTEALSSKNRLLLPGRNEARYVNTSDLIYLSESYPVYLEKMLSIGLGDSTMSFTRFAGLYKEIRSRNEDFAKRFYEMFELLKKEKRSNAVKPRYNNTFPAALEQCMQATRSIIVCDNVKQNWVYTAR